MSDSYQVIFTGQLQADAEPEVAIAAFASRFGAPEDKVRQLIGAGREVILKKDLDLAAAQQYRDALTRMGFVVRLDPDPEAPAADAHELALEPVPTPAPDPAPAAAQDTADSNPYSTPHAELDDHDQDGEIHDPVSVPAGNGWNWISSGFALFKRNPAAWIGAILLWLVISMVLGMIPLVSLAVTLLSGVIGGGFMLGARAQDEGEDFTVAHLFAGFSNNFGPLFLLGVFYLVGMVVIGAIIGITVGGSLFMAAGTGNPDPAVVQGLMSSPGVLIAILVGLLAMTALIMAYWFAPALVALDGVSTVGAMALSFKACAKNVLPLLVYGLLVVGLVLLGMLPFLLGLLVVIPVITASIYTGYRDIFYS